MAARAANALRGFLELIDEADAGSVDDSLAARAEAVVAASRLKEHFAKNRDGKGQDRIENLDELINACRQFELPEEDDGMSEMDAFLAHAALEAGDNQADEYEDCVQLMTLHSAKGLEFPMVFIGGVEEGLFPHSMSSEDPERLEEERRLCYVGMTRAMVQLYLTFAESRRRYGRETDYPLPSRFLREIPADVVEEVRARPQVRRPYAAANTRLDSVQESAGYRLGQHVTHPKFGDGVVLNAEGQGAGARVQVNFEAVGAKWLVVAYANLSPA